MRFFTFTFKGHLVLKLELKQTDGQTSKGDCITSCANKVNNNIYTYMYIKHAQSQAITRTHTDANLHHRDENLSF